MDYWWNVVIKHWAFPEPLLRRSFFAQAWYSQFIKALLPQIMTWQRISLSLPFLHFEGEPMVFFADGSDETEPIYKQKFKCSSKYHDVSWMHNEDCLYSMMVIRNTIFCLFSFSQGVIFSLNLTQQCISTSFWLYFCLLIRPIAFFSS